MVGGTHSVYLGSPEREEAALPEVTVNIYIYILFSLVLI
jgi:hypothetical protein